MKKYLWSVLMLFALASCEWWGNQPSFGDDFITYTIRTGTHEVEKNTNSLFTGNSMRFQALFDSSCIYKTVSAENQNDINKLMGFSDCSSQHHINSARFGWNWRENAIRIYAYIYIDGLRQEQELGVAEIGKAQNYALRTEGNSYIFTFNGVETVMPRHCSGGTGVSYKLLPYFGGDESAPQDIQVKIRNL
jgi:hypothetical protein